MKNIIIIPARYASSRYPGKPLAMLKGKDGISKPLIQRTYETAQQVSNIDAIYVATDDKRIKDCVTNFGGDVIMTREDCANGTERCADALSHLKSEPDLIINLQGDAPLTPHWFIENLIEAMQKDNPSPGVATPVLQCDDETYQHFIADRKNNRVGGTTAVFDNHYSALYFSKEVIPYLPEGHSLTPPPVYHHVGVYAYTPAALKSYLTWQEGPLEKNEGLEQLRFLENGHTVRCVEVDGQGRVFWELNNPIDVERIEKILF